MSFEERMDIAVPKLKMLSNFTAQKIGLMPKNGMKIVSNSTTLINSGLNTVTQNQNMIQLNIQSEMQQMYANTQDFNKQRSNDYLT